MADVIVGKSTKDKLVAVEGRTQIYGLAGNDTLISDNKSEILLIGGSGNDVLRMTGGSGTLSGGAGNDTFELNYSFGKKISAVIEDTEPTKDKIVVTFDGSKAPKLKYTVKGSDVIWTDDKGYFKLTLKGSSDASDYYEGNAPEYIWDILRITNEQREAKGLSPLTLSQGLTDGAAVRAKDTVKKQSHTRPNGSSCYTALKKSYLNVGENLTFGKASPEEAMNEFMNSKDHYNNVMNANFKKLGVGYAYDSSSKYKYHWTQMFGGNLSSSTKLNTNKILSTKITAKKGSLPKEEQPTINTNLAADNTLIKYGGTYKIAKNFSGVIRINTTAAVTIDGASAGNLRGVQIVTNKETANLTIKNLNVTNEEKSVITFGTGKSNKLTLAGTNSLKTSDTWAAVINVGGGLTVDGKGSVNLTAGTQGSGIGSNSDITSKADITIKNGSITSVTDLGAGIGSGANGSVGNIKITGGTFNTKSARASGVGKGYNGKVGSISFNGNITGDKLSFDGNTATISSSLGKVSYTGGKGNDTIDNNGANVLYKYAEGEGNDLIKGFDLTSTLKIYNDGSDITAAGSGLNVIVTVGKEKITLQGALPFFTPTSVKIVKVEETNLLVTDSSKSPVTVGSAIEVIDASSRKKAVKITGNKLDNRILGGTGNDSLYGGAGNDVFNGVKASDIFNVNGTAYKISGSKLVKK